MAYKIEYPNRIVFFDERSWCEEGNNIVFREVEKRNVYFFYRKSLSISRKKYKEVRFPKSMVFFIPNSLME